MSLSKKIVPFLLLIILGSIIVFSNTNSRDEIPKLNKNNRLKESDAKESEKKQSDLEFITRIYSAKKIEKNEIPIVINKMLELTKTQLELSSIEGNFEQDTFILLGNDGSGKIEYGFSTNKNILDKAESKDIKLVLITSEGEIFSSEQYSTDGERINFNIDAYHGDVEFVKLALIGSDKIHILVT